MFGFVAYQLWGTGVETARAQNKLDDQFSELVAEQAVEPDEKTVSVRNIVTDDGIVDDPTGDGVTYRALPLPLEADRSSGPPPTTIYEEIIPAAEQNLPDVIRGTVLGRIEIPVIGVDFKFVPGVTSDDLKLGVGHFPDTPLPGQLGNSALAGHRTTYKAPFARLDEVTIGDDIVVTLNNGEMFTYVVTGTTVVNPEDYWVIAESDPNRATLTLITCTPEFTSLQRLVAFAELDPSRSGAVGQATVPLLDEPTNGLLPDEEPTVTPTAEAPTVTTTPATTSVSTDTVTSATITSGNAVDAPVTTATTAPAAVVPAGVPAAPGEAFTGGWFDDTAAWPHIAGWGAALALIGIGVYLLSRKIRHYSVGILVGLAPFLFCLYFFYENVNRLLPPGI